MPKWLAALAALAAFTIGAVGGAITAIATLPVQWSAWGEVIILALLTAAGLIIASAVTFAAAERSTKPARDQALIATISSLDAMIDDIDWINNTLLQATLAIGTMKKVADKEGPEAIIPDLYQKLVISQKTLRYLEPDTPEYALINNYIPICASIVEDITHYGLPTFGMDNLSFDDKLRKAGEATTAAMPTFARIRDELLNKLKSARDVLHEHSV